MPTVAEQKSMQTLYPKCLDAMRRYMCLSAYPSCNPKAPLTDGVPDCAADLAAGKLDPSPATCNSVAMPLGSPSTLGGPIPACPAPLVETSYGELNPYLNRTGGGTCFGRCCLPCPNMGAFYRTGAIEQHDHINQYLAMGSSIGALFIFVSYAVLPNKRRLPALIVLFLSGAIAFWLGQAWLSFPDLKSVQCADEFDLGTMYMFGAHLSVVWACYLVANLHLSAVWRSNFLERHFSLISLVCWLWPVGWSTLIYMQSAIQYNTGATCLTVPGSSERLFFWPLSFLVIPAFLMHLWTFWTVARVTVRDTAWDGPHTGGSGDPGSHTGRRGGKAVLKAVTVQWRALGLALQIIVTFSVFYFDAKFVLDKFIQVDGSEPWFRDWVACVVLGNGQDACAARIADHVPTLLTLSACMAWVCSAGLILFALFGARASIWHEWRGWVARLGRKKAAPYANYL
ncbi:hypothetical protein BC828DRAFT_348876 [Blastocladiella britannica]|nr:hypothetical protein BC828DRAFT_348876 [Blastocladiella britannica]